MSESDFDFAGPPVCTGSVSEEMLSADSSQAPTWTHSSPTSLLSPEWEEATGGGKLTAFFLKKLKFGK